MLLERLSSISTKLKAKTVMSGDEALSATVSLGIPLDVVLTVSVMLKHVVQLFHCEPPVPKL